MPEDGRGQSRPHPDPGGVLRPRCIPERHRNVARGEGAKRSIRIVSASSSTPCRGRRRKARCSTTMFSQVFTRDDALSYVVLHDRGGRDRSAQHSRSMPPMPSITTTFRRRFSLSRRKGAHVASTYMDEFAERHTREMIVRDALGAMIPSAGVGTCLEQKAGQALPEGARASPDVGTVTEDYILGVEAKRAASTAPSPRCPPTPTKASTTWPRASSSRRRLPPRSNEGRWVYGINFEAMYKLGREGDLWNFYFFMRDRKGMITNSAAGLIRPVWTSASSTSICPTYRPASSRS